MLDAHHVRHVLAHAQQARPAGSVGVFQLGGLELPLVPRGVRHVLKEDVGLAEGKGGFVVLHEMPGRLCVEDLRVRQTYDTLRCFLVGVFGKGLVAGQVYAGFRVLGEGQGRHVVQQGGHGLLQFGHLSGFGQFLPVFLLLVVHDEGMQHARRQHIGHRVEGQVREPQLYRQEHGHDQPEGRQSQEPLAFCASRLLPARVRESVYRDQEQEEDLGAEADIPERQGLIDAVGADGKENRGEDVDDGKHRDQQSQHIAGDPDEPAEGVLLLRISDGEPRPVQDARRHRDVVQGGVGKQRHDQLAAFKEAPEDVRDVIEEDDKQKLPVHLPGGSVEGGPAADQDIVVHDEQDQDGQDADRGIIHRLFPYFSLFFSSLLFSYICWSARSNTGATDVSPPRRAMPQAITMPPVCSASSFRRCISCISSSIRS